MTSHSHVMRVIFNPFPNLNLVNNGGTVGMKEEPTS